MGKILQIQVRAWTYDDDDVVRAWPQLAALVWDESDRWRPVGAKRGVMELVAALNDVTRFGDMPDETRKILAAAVPGIESLGAGLQKALADWQPVQANQLSDSLEDAITALEKKLPGEKSA